MSTHVIDLLNLVRTLITKEVSIRENSQKKKEMEKFLRMN